MGTKARHKPGRLGDKLLHIRTELGLSQNELIRRMGVEELAKQNTISEFELGKREPPLRILLQYARLAGISTDVLIDDEVDLPKKIPVRRG